jgi:hypothetical protein
MACALVHAEAYLITVEHSDSQFFDFVLRSCRDLKRDCSVLFAHDLEFKIQNEMVSRKISHRLSLRLVLGRSKDNAGISITLDSSL